MERPKPQSHWPSTVSVSQVKRKPSVLPLFIISLSTEATATPNLYNPSLQGFLSLHSPSCATPPNDQLSPSKSHPASTHISPHHPPSNAAPTSKKSTARTKKKSRKKMHQTYHHYPLYSQGPRAFATTLPPMFPPYYPPSPPSEYYTQEPCGVIPHNPHHSCSCSGECRSNFAPHQRSFAPVSALPRHLHPHHPSSSHPVPITSSSSLPTAPSPYWSSSSSTSGAAFYSQYSASYPTSPTPVSPPWSVSSSPQSTSPPQSSSPVAQRFCHIMPAGKAPPKALLFIEERYVRLAQSS